MDDLLSIYMTIKELMKLFRRGRAQVDRYRKREDFPKPIRLSDSQRGGVLYLRAEILDWMRSRT
jgi:predicted DNA-binding transcriptional regulator AlpA